MWTASLRRELSREIKTKHVSRCAGKGLGRPLVEETENKYSDGWPVSPGARRAPGGGAGAGTPRRRDRPRLGDECAMRHMGHDYQSDVCNQEEEAIALLSALFLPW